MPLMKCAILLFATAVCLPANIVTLTPSSPNVNVGETLSVNVNIDSVPSLYSFFFGLNFDPEVLQVIAVNEGSLFFNTGVSSFDPGITNNTTGSVTGIFDTLFGPDGVNGPGTLATVNFSAIGKGNTQVAIFPTDPGYLVLQNFDQAYNGSGQLPVTTVPTNIVSVATPEPSLAIPLVVALFGLMALHKRRSARS